MYGITFFYSWTEKQSILNINGNFLDKVAITLTNYNFDYLYFHEF